MGRHATALLPFSLLVGIVFQDLASAMRPLVGIRLQNGQTTSSTFLRLDNSLALLIAPISNFAPVVTTTSS